LVYITSARGAQEFVHLLRSLLTTARAVLFIDQSSDFARRLCFAAKITSLRSDGNSIAEFFCSDVGEALRHRMIATEVKRVLNAADSEW
jgi:hypothetical protein